MRRVYCSLLLIISMAFFLPACGGGGYSGGTATGSGSGGGGGNTQCTTDDQFFTAKVQPSLDFCRNCHVTGGIADTDKGRRFMLSSNSAEDFVKVHTAWETLGKGVETNRILLKASNTDPEPHSGGAPWPKDGPAYNNMKTLLQCWDNPAGCAALLGGASCSGGGGGGELPLLGDLQANGGRNYSAVHCEGKPDSELLPMDPRELIAGENLENPNYAVWYNDAFEICETPTLFENQKKQNELLGFFPPGDPRATPEKPWARRVYTAKERPATCGQWRADVEHGRLYIMQNPITGAIATRQTLYNLISVSMNGFPATGQIPSDPQEVNELLAKVAQQRYGWPSHPYRNPFPMPNEDPNAPGVNGGSIQLPIALVQTKNDDGSWSGKFGATCFACHVGQIGRGEVVGNSAARDGHPELYGGSPEGTFLSLNGSNTDTGMALWDVQLANGTFGQGPNDFSTGLNNPGFMATRARGTNAADQEIIAFFIGRDFDTLDWRFGTPEASAAQASRAAPSAPFAGGDQDIPSWWWTHNKSRYLWVGLGSSGSARGNFFPSTTNPYNGHWSKRREADYQDLDMWLNAVEAPKFVGPPIDTKLAEQGAILFHNKNLWANTTDSTKPDYNDIPRPPGGNGACAGCHGAYSPRYINQAGFLPDPSLAGMTGYTVPLTIIGTDPAQSDIFTAGSVGGVTNPAAPTYIGFISNSWWSYPDARPNYRLPEEKSPQEEYTDDGSTPSPGACILGTKGGYSAQPLHGVWASGPYLHNGSMPTVWDLLKPSDRPDVWRRQRVPESEAAPYTNDRGFDTDLTRAYDYEKLGWKYERLTCADLGANNPNSNALTCTVEGEEPNSVVQFLLMPLKALLDYFSPPYYTPSDYNNAERIANRTIYNTHMYSKSNQGHEFTKVLTDQERLALIEYLKTL